MPAQERHPVPRHGADIQKSPLSGRPHHAYRQQAEVLGWIPAFAGMTMGTGSNVSKIISKAELDAYRIRMGVCIVESVVGRDRAVEPL